MTIILASTSPRRRALMAQLEVPFEVAPGDVEERKPFAGEHPSLYVLALACEKALATARKDARRPVLGADTVVTLGGVILGKPSGPDEAVDMLRRLRGQTHVVVTGVAVFHDGLRADVETARVDMRAYTDEEISAYVASGEPLDKAGAYGIQGLGGNLVAAVQGCFNTVVGLPLCLVRRLLAEAGVEIPDLPTDPCGHNGEKRF